MAQKTPLTELFFLYLLDTACACVLVNASAEVPENRLKDFGIGSERSRRSRAVARHLSLPERSPALGAHQALQEPTARRSPDDRSGEKYRSDFPPHTSGEFEGILFTVLYLMLDEGD